MGVVGGAVSVTDSNGTIKTISLDGYGAGSSTTTTSVLETLNISNSDQDLTVAAAAAGGLTVNAENIGTKAANGAITKGTLTLTAAPTTLNVASTGDNYVTLTAAATTDLNVSGTGLLDVSTNDLVMLKNVVVTESAGLTLNAGVTDTLASVDTTGTTGTVTTSLDGQVGTYTGGAGVDNVTLSTSTALTKDIDLGAGDDTLSFAALNVTGSTKTLSGGAGTDTLSMAVATAATLDGAAQSFYTNFERLTLNDIFGTIDAVADAETINLANLGFTNYVTTSGTQVNGVNGATATDTLTLDKLASNGTVVLTALGNIAVNVTDAATGTADVLNLAASVKSADLNVGTLTAANVETVNINFEDTVADDNFDGDTTDAGDAPETISMVLTADKATTVNVTGSANANLTLTGSTKVATIDGSTMTGNLTVTNLNTTTATTIKGGSGSDVLNAGTGSNAVVLEGGAGNDVLVANKGLSTLTGGDGADVFHIAQASLTSSSYSTITDFTAEDLLQINGATKFLSTEITQADTASFQDYANAAVNTLAANEVTWFQYGDNTYVVMDAGFNGAQFDNNEDFIVKLTGLVDLSGASFNDTYYTIAL
jgi:S-layer protein